MKGKPAAKEVHEEAMRHLKKADPVLYKAALPHYRDIKPRSTAQKRYSNQKLFASLAGAVTGQQLSTKAADSIWDRLEKACGGEVTPEAIKRIRATTMRKAGLSNAKVKTLKELSKAVLSGGLELVALRKLPEEDAIARLSRVWGIGRWTAEMFLMFALEREDVFSPGDLGLIRSMEMLYGIEPNSKAHVYEAVAFAWAPHRSFASRILWRVRDVPSPKGMG